MTSASRVGTLGSCRLCARQAQAACVQMGSGQRRGASTAWAPHAPHNLDAGPPLVARNAICHELIHRRHFRFERLGRLVQRRQRPQRSWLLRHQLARGCGVFRVLDQPHRLDERRTLLLESEPQHPVRVVLRHSVVRLRHEAAELASSEAALRRHDIRTRAPRLGLEEAEQVFVLRQALA